MERFLSREADSVRAPIDGKDYQRAEDGGVVHVGGGVPFPTDMEARERKLARQEKLLLKERIYKLLYDEKGQGRLFSTIVAGTSVVIAAAGFLCGVGKVAKLIFGISNNDIPAFFLGSFIVIAVAIISGAWVLLSLAIGTKVMDNIKEFIKS